MKIALVRGPNLTRWEMQSFDGLVPAHELTAFVTAGSPALGQPNLPCRMVPLFWWGDVVTRIHPLLGRWVNGAASRLGGVSFAMKGLVDALRGFDVIHTLETHTSFSYQAALAKKRYGSRLVATVWETIPHRGENHPVRKGRKRAVIQAANAFIAVTDRSRRMLLEDGADPARIHVVPMGIDLRHFNPRVPDPAKRAMWRVRSGEFVIVCIARLVPEKGIFHLLEAVARLTSSAPEAYRLVLVGVGPQEAVWKRWVQARGLEERILFAGPAPYDEIPAILSSADVLALPSVQADFWEEQFGYVLAEAMATGIPVLSTTSGAIPEVVGDAGLLVPPGSADALAEAIARLRGDRALRERFRTAGLERAKARYDARQVASRLNDLYSSLVKG